MSRTKSGLSAPQGVIKLRDIFLTITTKTFRKISTLPKPDQALYIYMFYLNQSKIQDDDIIHAPVPFVMEKTKYGRAKVVSARKGLNSIGLIEDFRPTIGSKTYVKLNESEGC